MDDLRKNLETLGFSQNESKVFLVTMKGNTMTAAEIAEEAGIPRPSVYEILRSFTEKGFCNEIETPSKLYYQMIDPDVVEDKIERELNNTYNSKIGQLKGSFGKLKSLYNPGGTKNEQLQIELLRGFNKHRAAKFIELIEASNEEILLMNRLEARVSSEVNDVVERFIKRGGTFKTIYETSTNFKVKLEDKWVQVDKSGLIALCRSSENAGVKTRLAESVPQNFAIFDKKTVFLNIVDENIEKANKDDIIIRNKRYGSLMRDTFENYWSNGQTIEEFESKN